MIYSSLWSVEFFLVSIIYFIIFLSWCNSTPKHFYFHEEFTFPNCFELWANEMKWKHLLYSCQKKFHCTVNLIHWINYILNQYVVDNWCQMLMFQLINDRVSIKNFQKHICGTSVQKCVLQWNTCLNTYIRKKMYHQYPISRNFSCTLVL